MLLRFARATAWISRSSLPRAGLLRLSASSALGAAALATACAMSAAAVTAEAASSSSPSSSSTSDVADTKALVTMEFAVEMTCSSCVQAVTTALRTHPRVRRFRVDLDTQQVLAVADCSVLSVLEQLESTGMKALVRGLAPAAVGDGDDAAADDDAAGAVAAPPRNLGCAVAPILGSGINPYAPDGAAAAKAAPLGMVRFVQLSEQLLLVDAAIDGLTPGPHGLHIHEYGDLSGGCASTGGHYNPRGCRHGGPPADDDGGAAERHAGDLGNIVANAAGRGELRLLLRDVGVAELIGRAVVVHADEDDCGRLRDDASVEAARRDASAATGNAGARLACGIIARSAGVLENSKRVCLCSGATLWEDGNFTVGASAAK